MELEELLLKRISKEGFAVEHIPSGDGLCFYAATGYQLGISTNETHSRVFDYLQQHRYDVSI